MIEYLVLGGAALGAYGWERLRRRQLTRRYHEALGHLDDEAQVALHLAEREARARHQALTPEHLAYGLVQDAAFAAQVRALGGDPDVIEQRALDRLDEPWSPERGQRRWRAQHEVGMVLGTAIASARARARPATCGDLYARLAQTSALAVFEDAGLDPLALQFACVHGHPPPPLERPGEPTINVVIRNDDVTAAALVAALLAEDLGLPAARAAEVTQAAHADGRAVVGAFASADARERLTRARARLRAARAPLWIGVEPC